MTTITRRTLIQGVSALALAGNIRPALAASDTLVIAMDGDVKTFNVAQQFDQSWYPSTLYYERMVATDFGPYFKPIPQLAKSWDVSPDGMVYTFHLQENVRWHDGEPFSSNDVKYTVQAALDNKTYNSPEYAQVAEMETPDPLTFVMKLKRPTVSMIYNISTFPRTAILPAHLYEGTDFKTNPANFKPVGTGPYKFEEHRPGEYLSFVRNEEYWGPKPLIKRVVFKIVSDPNVQIAQLQSGEVHAINMPPSIIAEPILRASPGVEVESHPTPVIFDLAFNQTKPPFDNPAVRKALSFAIDRKQIAEVATLNSFRPASGSFTPVVAWAFNPDAKLPERDIEKAKALLDEAGYVEKDGTRLSFEILAAMRTAIDAAQVIKAQLKPLGIDVRVVTMDETVFRQTLPQMKQDSYIHGYSWGPDPSVWAQYNVSNGFWNRMGYANPKIDELFREQELAITQDERKKFLFEIQKILVEDMPRLVLVDSGPYSFAHRAELSGWFTQEPVSYRLDLRNLRWNG